MGKSLQLGTVAGIKLQVHWSFSLIVAWVMLTNILAGKSFLAAMLSVAFVLVLFGCVLLHELGHALAARMYGIPTRDITLLPIGGVARLERMPRDPWQEIVVAFAGPAVNVVIAAVLFMLLAPATTFASFVSLPAESGSFLQRLMFVNIALVVFNLLPAFPMDGGRVLRACLALFMDYVAATRVAAFVGQLCAVGLGFLGLYNPMLLLVAAFIFLAAAGEANQVALRDKYGNAKVGDGMIRKFRAIDARAPLRQTVLDLLETPQSEFPVIENGQFVGMLQITDALNAIQNRSANTVGQAVTRPNRLASEGEPILSVLESQQGPRSIPVVNDGVLVGLINPRLVFELLDARSRMTENSISYAHIDRSPVPEFS